MLSIDSPVQYFIVFFIFSMMSFVIRSQSLDEIESYIVLTSNVDYQDNESTPFAVYRIRPDGTEFQKIVDVEESPISGVDCHSDTNQFVIASNFEYLPYLYTVSFDGSNLTKHSETRGSIQDVSFSPDGQQVAYSTLTTFYSIDLEFEEKIMLTDLTKQTHETFLREVGIAYRDPQWSPDGRQILYSYHPEKDWGGNHGIGIFTFDGSNSQVILETEIWVGHPSWSPDGNYIVFSKEENNHKNLFIMLSNGSEQVQLTNDSFDNIRPHWSPDGKWISFSSNRNDNTYQIFLLNMESKAIHQVSNNDGDNFNQCWMQIKK